MIFGSMFDFDQDGHLDPIEQAMEFQFAEMLMEEEAKAQEESTDYNSFGSWSLLLEDDD